MRANPTLTYHACVLNWGGEFSPLELYRGERIVGAGESSRNRFDEFAVSKKKKKPIRNCEFSARSRNVYMNRVPITAVRRGMFFYNKMWSTVSEHGQVKLQGILNIVKNSRYIIVGYLLIFGTNGYHLQAAP